MFGLDTRLSVIGYTTANLRCLSEELDMGHIANVSAMITEVEKDDRGK